MTHIAVEEVVPQLERIIEVMSAGEEVILTHDSRPIARLSPLVGAGHPANGSRREPGSATGLITYMAEDFDNPIEDFEDLRQ